MNSNWRLFIRDLPIVGPLLRRVYRSFVPPVSEPSFWIGALTDSRKRLVVQIGSNDGVSNDPLHEHLIKNRLWQAILVEPLPHLFEKLKKNYPSDARFRFVNAAINDGTEQPFYFLKEEAAQKLANMPPWFNQLGSFDREHLLKHLPASEPYIHTIMIKGVTLPDLLSEGTKPDILHIDAEGYDWKILSQLDVPHVQPGIILFEQKHLSEVDRKAAIRFLAPYYELFQLNGDFLCVHRIIFKDHRAISLMKQKVSVVA